MLFSHFAVACEKLSSLIQDHGSALAVLFVYKCDDFRPIIKIIGQ